MKKFTFILFVVLSVVDSTVNADVTTFTETFDNDSSGWLTAINTEPMYDPAGGPDGTGGISFTASIENLGLGTVFRDSIAAGSASGGAFVGDWLASGVETFSFSFRHDATVPLTLFGRFAGPGNFPAAVGTEFAPVLPGIWTDIVVPIDPNSPGINVIGGDFDSIFSSIGNLQIGITAPDGFDQTPEFSTDFTYELDNVGITTSVPEPTAAMALCVVGVGVLNRRRQS